MLSTVMSWSAQAFAMLFQDVPSRRITGLALMLSFALAIGSHWLLIKLQHQYGILLNNAMTAGRSVLHLSVETWWKNRARRVAGWVEESDVLYGSLATLREQRGGGKRLESFAHANEHLQIYMRNLDFTGYALIDAEEKIIYSSLSEFENIVTAGGAPSLFTGCIKSADNGGDILWKNGSGQTSGLIQGENRVTFLFCASITEKKGGLKGYLVGVVDPEVVLFPLLYSAQFGKTGEAVLVDSAGRLLEPSQSNAANDALRFLPPTTVPAIQNNLNLHGHASNSGSERFGKYTVGTPLGFPSGYKNYRGENVVGVWGSVGQSGMLIGIEVSAEEVSETLVIARRAIRVVTATFIVIILALALLVIRDRKRKFDAIKAISAAEENLQSLWRQADETGKFVRAVVDSLRVAIAVINTQGRIQLTNGVWTRQSEHCGAGGDMLQPIGLDYFVLCARSNAFLPEEPKILEGIRSVLTRTKAYFWSEYKCCPVGEERWYMVNVEPLNEGEGAVISHADITGKKMAVLALESSERRLRTLIEMAEDGIITTDNTGKIELFSPAAEKIFHFRADEVVGLDITLLVEDFSETWLTLVEGNIQSREVQVRNREGVSFPAEISVSKLIVDNKRYFTVIMRDITQRKKIEMQIRQSKELAERYLDISGAIIVGLDRLGLIRVINPRGCVLVGYQLDEVIGRDWLDLVVPVSERSELREYFNEIIATDGQLPMSHWRGRILKKWGDAITVIWDIHIDRDDRGGISQILLSGQDITEQHLYEGELIRAKLSAEQASRAKSDFLSSMSHEIRTPLNAIVGFSEIMSADQTLNGVQTHHVSTIYRAATHLLALINDILDLSAIEAGKFNIESDQVELSTVVKQCIGLSQAAAGERNIQVIDRVRNANGKAVIADNRRLQQVVLNLLSNAIKYNKPGGRVYVSSVWSKNKNSMRLIVIDTGPGIPPDKLPFLFQRFNRLGQEKNVTVGTGIGLVLCKNLVEAMGGRIGVRSWWGKGTLFWVALHTGLIQAQPSGRADSAAVNQNTLFVKGTSSQRNPLKVLVVEDHVDNQELFRVQLRKLGVSPTFASNGVEGYAKWRAGEYDIVLTDIHMPEMDGVELIEAIRAAEKNTFRDTYIVVVSADVLSDEIRRAYAAGCDDSLTKPVELDKFREVLFADRTRTNRAPEQHKSVATTDLPIDRNVLRDLVGDDESAHTDILEKFTLRSTRLIEEMEGFCREKALDALGATAHKFTTSARAIGAKALGDACRRLEAAARARDWGASVAVFDELRTAHARVLEALARGL
ncbi:MAG: PAS domain S-box protein [Gammaproteobacteria bacterium]|nr:PAS domain S-box protein [Gammaproteobacteria bacterium]